MEQASKRHEDKYNSTHRIQAKEIEKGDKVLVEVKNTKIGQKLRPSYSGPFGVKDVKGSMVKIQNNHGKIQDVHKNNVKSFVQLPTRPINIRSSIPVDTEEIDSDDDPVTTPDAADRYHDGLDSEDDEPSIGLDPNYLPNDQ